MGVFIDYQLMAECEEDEVARRLVDFSSRLKSETE